MCYIVVFEPLRNPVSGLSSERGNAANEFRRYAAADSKRNLRVGWVGFAQQHHVAALALWAGGHPPRSRN